MVKSLIFCTLMNCSLLISVPAQDVKPVQDDSLINQGNHFIIPGLENQNRVNRTSGYAGIITTGSQTAYYGGLQYALKDNQSLRFEMLYGTGNNFLLQPGLNYNSRIVAPSLLYEYTIIGKSGIHNPYGYNSGSNGFSLYGFTGIGAQMFIQGNSLNTNETHLSNANNKNLNIVIPLGLGMQYKFDNDMTIGLEIRGNFHISNGGYNPYSYGMNSYQNFNGQWGYPGGMFTHFRNGPGF
jgi:opacity protein-like surface antigen